MLLFVALLAGNLKTQNRNLYDFLEKDKVERQRT